MTVVSSQKSVARIAVGGRRSAVILAGLMLAALTLRLWRLEAVFWYDEAFSAWLASLPLKQLMEAAAGDVHPPGYYLLLWAVTWPGHSESVLRLPSVAAGVLLIWVVNRLSIALQQDKKAVWLATTLTAFAPFQIYYSQEARAYSLLMLAVTTAALGLIQMVNGQRSMVNGQFLAVGGSLAALYLNNLAPLFLAVLWLAACTLRAPRFTLHAKRFFIAGGITALGYLPGFVLALHQAGSVGAGYWIPPVTSPGRILATLDDLLWFTPNNPFVIATGMLTALGLALIGLDLVKSTSWPPAEHFTKMLAIIVFGPLSLVTIISMIWQPILISRAVAPLAPFYYLLLAGAVTRSASRLVTFGLLAGPTALLILAGPLIGEMGRPVGDMRLLNLYGEYQPGDGLYHANVGSYVVWRYYRPDMPQYLWPQETTVKQTLSTVTRRAMGMQEADFESIKCAPATQDAWPKRWWLIQFNNPVTSQAEIAYVDTLVSHNPSRKISLLRSDATVEAWLYLIEPVCP